MKFYDISLPISNNLPVWPGDPLVSLHMASSISKGDQCNVTRIEMGAHSGTHIDAPYHYLEDGVTIDTISPETFIGPCLVIEVDSEMLVREKELKKYDFDGYSRILIKTRNSKLLSGNAKPFDKNYVSLGIDAAQYLVEMNVILVGIDYLSIESFQSDGCPIHKLLLRNNVIILEGLNLSEVSEGPYELICTPLNLHNCEAAPTRALLLER